MKTLNKLHNTTGWTNNRLAGQSGVANSTLRRWKHRTKAGKAPVQEQGRKPIGPQLRAEILARLEQMSHRAKRTRGTLALQHQYAGKISRRQLAELVAEARRRYRQQRRARLRVVEWKQPGVVWSLDDTELEIQTPRGRVKWLVHHVQDLGSRYKFSPVVAKKLPGTMIAMRLEALFKQYGPPLVLKRDNGGNLNHFMVNAVLSRYGVIALNSPTHYAPYNGGMEHAQGELKPVMLEKLKDEVDPTNGQVQVAAENGVVTLNHGPRSILDGWCSCSAFFDGGKKHLPRYTLSTRREVHEQIKAMAEAIMKNNRRAPCAAWRCAVETWLQKHGVIAISENPRVSPNFGRKNAHL